MLPDGLLDAVKNYLDITWTDAATDSKLTGIIERGIKYIDKAAGEECNYTAEDKPRELLFDYCRYARSNALDQFQTNYLPELLTLQNEMDIKRYNALVKLSQITIGSLALDPVFNADIKLYKTSTSNDGDAITAVKSHPLAEICIYNGGTAVENGTAAKWLNGENTITIVVTNGYATATYTVVVTKE